MGLKVEDDRFYVLEVGREKWVHNTVGDAIQALRERVQAEEVDSDDIRVVEVSILKRKWNLREVSWVKIALGLIRGETVERGKSG